MELGGCADSRTPLTAPPRIANPLNISDSAKPYQKGWALGGASERSQTPGGPWGAPQQRPDATGYHVAYDGAQGLGFRV